MNYKFPSKKPNVKKRLNERGEPDGWCHGEVRDAFKEICTPQTKHIINGGAWLGQSAQVLYNLAPNAMIYCIDHWKGSEEHSKMVELVNLYETFIVNLWDYQDRIVPVKENSVFGMYSLFRNNIKPDVVFIDWAHDEQSVYGDVLAALKYFPDAIICGDDWTWPGVRYGLACVEREEDIEIKHGEVFWRIK